MRTILRIVNLPTRLASVPRPVDLRYLDKDDKGHTRIYIRTTHRKSHDDAIPTPAQHAALSRPQG